MALKFLNKKGWHTGSLRNIENVWKAEQKHGVEQKKLEELRKQIQEERERAEFRLLQERAGLAPYVIPLLSYLSSVQFGICDKVLILKPSLSVTQEAREAGISL